jgi:tetratricopeptide (TPR) repeat protein
MLMDGQFYANAISHYNEAIAQYPQAWVALEGLARSYGEQEEYQLAIDWQTKAIDAIPERLKWIGGYLYPRIATWSSLIGNNELSFNAARDGFFAEAWSLDAQLKYLEALHMRGDSDTILETIELLNDRIADGEEYSWLVRFFVWGHDAYGEIGNACRMNGQSTWVLQVMDEALNAVDRGDRLWIKVWLPLKMALFNYCYYDDREDETIRLGEMFLERLGRQEPSFQESYRTERTSITHKLAQLYFDKATALFNLTGGVSSEDIIFADKLKALAVSVETSFATGYDGFDFFRKDYPSLLWGRWLRDYRKAEDKVWRKCFKVRLLEEMNSLDDDDPTNDTSGMASLAISLFHAGDRRNAAAILAILFKPLEDMKAAEGSDGDETHGEENKRTTEVATTEDVQATLQSGGDDLETHDQAGAEAEDNKTDEEIRSKLIGPQEKDMVPPPPKRPAQTGRGLSLNVSDESWMYMCDNCGRDPSEVAELYFCEVCQDTNWCDECLAKVRDASIQPGLKEHQCNPNHDAYRAWPVPDEAKGLAVEYLEGEVALRREWLEKLRGEWLKAGV